ncbi:MAG: ribonuclease HII [bacterium]|nr:ribonuclease HII [bacterium]
MVKPNFDFEKLYWKKGYKVVVGVDEVGRGCFAGPIVAAAVVFKGSRKSMVGRVGRKGTQLSTSSTLSTLTTLEALGINDSKKLKPKERERLEKEIKKYALAWGIAEIPTSVINRLGMGKACARVMRKAIRQAQGKLSGGRTFVLVDGYHVKYIPSIGLKRQKPIIDGDQKSISIAAASILAKVYRDKLMRKLSTKYPQFGWGRNKGYGTLEHQKAILRYGMTRYHRKQFIHTWQENNDKKGKKIAR